VATTSGAQPAPGTVVFDNFRAARGAGSAAGEVVIYASDVVAPLGWQHVADATAAAGVTLATTNQGLVTEPARAAPATYFDVGFPANAGVRYRVWVRLRAASNATGNDSVWVQFSDAVNQLGQAVYRTGTPQALLVNLENCTGCGVSGWGWQDGAHWLADTGEVWFAASGTHTVRVQVREDGVEVDQIVISPGDYVDVAPGSTRADATIVARPTGRPVVSLTAPVSGATFTAPASMALQASASDSDGTVARVDFYAGATLLGSDTTSPYAFT